MSRESIIPEKISRVHLYKEKTLHIEVLITSKNRDTKVIQPISTTSEAFMEIVNWNEDLPK